MSRVALSPANDAVTSDTGVAKSTTSRRRRNSGGIQTLLKDNLTPVAVAIISALTLDSDNAMIMRPSPAVPRRKSILVIDGPCAGVTASGEEAAGMLTPPPAVFAMYPPSLAPTSTIYTLPSARLV